MCLSGIDAIALADQLIRAGEFDVVVAGGQESMTQAPHLLMNSRSGYKYGDVTALDSMAYDGLHDVFTDQPMGALTEQRNDVDQFTRAQQDEYAARSHQRAAAAWKDGVYADEVVPVKIPQRKGDPIEFTEDEGIRANTTAESLAGLKPAFRKDGTITAGSASQISDGGAALVIMDKDEAERRRVGDEEKVAMRSVRGEEQDRERDALQGERRTDIHRGPPRQSSAKARNRTMRPLVMMRALRDATTRWILRRCSRGPVQRH